MAEMDDVQYKLEFEREIFNIKNSKTQNCVLLTRQEYNFKLQRLLELENLNVARTPSDFKLMKIYDYMIQREGEHQSRRLIRRGTTLLCVPIEDLYSILKSAHLQLRHAGRNAMQLFFRDKYCNITKDAIMSYLQLCKNCPRKKKIRDMKTHLEPLNVIDMLDDDDDNVEDSCSVSSVPPVFADPKFNGVSQALTPAQQNSGESFTRGQVDVIDMRDRCDGKYQYILKYTNMQTNEVRLKPTQYGNASEAANLLVDIYCEQGAPVVLQSLNGREFVQEVVSEIVKIWPNCRQLHGSVKSQDLSSNQNVIDQLHELQKRLKTNVWAQLLRFLQWEMNTNYNADTGRSTLESILGKQPSLGLPPSKLLEAVYDKAQSEEQMMDYIADAELLRLSAFCSNACQQGSNRTYQTTSAATASINVSTGHFIDESHLLPPKVSQNNGPSYVLQSAQSTSSLVKSSEVPLYLDYQSLQMSVEAERQAQESVNIQPSPPQTAADMSSQQQQQPQTSMYIQQMTPQSAEIGPGSQQNQQQQHYIEIIQMKGEIGNSDGITLSTGSMEHFNL